MSDFYQGFCAGALALVLTSFTGFALMVMSAPEPAKTKGRDRTLTHRL